MKVAGLIIGSLLLSIPILYAVGALLASRCHGSVAGVGLLARTLYYRVANMRARGPRAIVDGAMVSPPVRVSRAECAPARRGASSVGT